MSRTKTGVLTKKRHKKIIKFNKGYKGSHSRLFKVANQEYMHSLKYAYIDRKKRKNDFRRIWIKQINNSIKEKLIKYSKFIKILKRLKIELNRKILSSLSIIDKETFELLIKKE